MEAHFCSYVHRRLSRPREVPVKDVVHVARWGGWWKVVEAMVTGEALVVSGVVNQKETLFQKCPFLPHFTSYLGCRLLCGSCLVHRSTQPAGYGPSWEGGWLKNSWNQWDLSIWYHMYLTSIIYVIYIFYRNVLLARKQYFFLLIMYSGAIEKSSLERRTSPLLSRWDVHMIWYVTLFLLEKSEKYCMSASLNRCK